MPKKIITIEVDTDEISNALKSKDKVILKLMVASSNITGESTGESEYPSSEDMRDMEKEIGWPF